MQASAMSERPDTLAPLPPILVVDDSRTNRQLLRELLEPAGYKVLEAADEDSALKLAHSKRPGCVLLDIRMPGLDGFEVPDRLKQDPRSATSGGHSRPGPRATCSSPSISRTRSPGCTWPSSGTDQHLRCDDGAPARLDAADTRRRDQELEHQDAADDATVS